MFPRERSISPDGDQGSQEAYKFWRYPTAPKSPTVWFHTPSSSPSIASCPIRIRVTRTGYQEPPGGGKVCPHQPCAAWYEFLVASREVNLQPAPVHLWPTENLPLSPPLRQDANLRPDRKPHLWYPSSAWDPAYPPPSCSWQQTTSTP